VYMAQLAPTWAIRKFAVTIYDISHWEEPAIRPT
jgi:hypothetical protein